ncbi:alpha/beta hydrolase [Dechloromonas sp. XY25]|uniref:Alpha/beta hydrolase n=1 Tax=Dechloromonas hankyongensis TaxID=2908002 RepID=A0ABS9K4C3_9RHOO|nr:alpha/beta hydrolase [Dechloromonas hankyongensis]MCG2577925.1 alpha/beta hydrolase [Dechloromonas hankyongensis]
MENTSPDTRVKAGLLLAAALSLTALWVRRRAKKAEQKFPPAGKFVQIDGVRLHYIEHGTGPAVLLLHGNGAQAMDFVGCGLVEQLASRYRVIAIDRPGFGYSARPRDRLWTPKAQATLMRRACAELGVQEPIVLGHSFGTQVALALALEAPEWVRGLVLISGYYFPTFRLDAWLFSPPAIPVIGDVMRYTVSPLLGKMLLPLMLRRIFSPKVVEPGFLQHVPPPLTLRPWQLKASAEDGIFMIPAAIAMSRHYREISVPVEIFAGEDDKYVKADQQAARLHHQIEQSRLHLLPGEGHMLHYGKSRGIAGAVGAIVATEEVVQSIAEKMQLIGENRSEGEAAEPVAARSAN